MFFFYIPSLLCRNICNQVRNTTNQHNEEQWFSNPVTWVAPCLNTDSRPDSRKSWVSGSGMKPDNLHFQPGAKWRWCRCSRDHIREPVTWKSHHQTYLEPQHQGSVPSSAMWTEAWCLPLRITARQWCTRSLHRTNAEISSNTDGPWPLCSPGRLCPRRAPHPPGCHSPIPLRSFSLWLSVQQWCAKVSK